MDSMATLEIVLIAFLFFTILMVVYQSRRANGYIDLLEDAIDTPGHGLIFFDEKSNFMRANGQAFRYLPFLEGNPESLTSLENFMDYLYDNSLECDENLRKVLDRTAKKLPNQGFREVIQWDDDKICSVEAQRTKGGRIILILIDISGYQQQEQDFTRVSRNNYQMIQAIEATASGVVVSEAKLDENKVIFANKAAGELLDTDSANITGQMLENWLSALCDQYEQDKVKNAFVDGNTVDFQVELSSAENVARWLNLKLTPIRGSDGHIDLFIVVFNDITELKMKEAEIFQSQKLEALGQLSAGIAHDFNNILSIVDGYARITSQKCEEDDDTYSYMDKIRSATARGAALTKKMLTFSRRKVVSDHVIDLCEVVKEQEALLVPLLSAGIGLSVIASEESVFVECSQDSIAQILINMAANARDAMPNGGSLIVDVQKVESAVLPAVVPEDARDKNYVLLSVTDTGDGIPPEVIEKIFDPFFTTKEQGKGTGLGLSVVYGLIREMNGYLDVVSSRGRGTTMRIYMPLSDKEPDKKLIGNMADAKSIKLEGYTVLIAEDEDDLRILMTGMLEEMGMNVIAAANGNEALLKQDDYEGEIDFLLTDLVMPELNGVQLAELFQSVRPHAKIVFMSGYPANSRDAQMDLPELPKAAILLAKPFEYEDLASLLYSKVSNKNDGEDSITSGTWESNEAAEG